MFQGIKNGTELIKESIRALKKYPTLLIPLLIIWAIFTPIAIHSKYFVDWDAYSTSTICLVVFAQILLFSLLYSWSAFMQLEYIRQIEMDEDLRTGKAFSISFTNTLIALPIVMLWAVIWFILTILEALFNRKKSSSDEDFNAENVAKTIAGYNQFSLSGAFFEAVKKGVRMLVFLIFPAIAWEKRGTFDAIKKGLGVANTHKTEFATGFVLTELAAMVVFLPPTILFFVTAKLEITLPDIIWLLVILYCAFAWSFSLFLEQMFVAELYLWHIMWEKAVDKAIKNGEPEPILSDVKRPSLMDNVTDLFATNVPGITYKSIQTRRRR